MRVGSNRLDSSWRGAVVTALCLTTAGLLASAMVVSVAGPARAPGSAKIRLQADGAQLQIRLVGVLTGLDPELRQVAESVDWTEAFPVRVAGRGQDPAAGDLPPVLGHYRLAAADVVFAPRFPFSQGLHIVASFHPRQLGPGLSMALGPDFSETIHESLHIPARRPNPAASVSEVYPTASLLPENLLKFYLHFSHPMAAGVAYRHVHLLDEDGDVVELPFLELEPELWDVEQRRLTLFFDPGRIKRGLLPNQRVGSPLQQGRTYIFRVDRSWPDAEGVPLKQGFEKRFQVGPPDRQSPDPQSWRLDSPTAATLDPLTVTFPEAMDRALMQRLISVVGPDQGQLQGRVVVSDHERRWAFLPEAAWVPGKYRLDIGTVLEDLAGNAVSGPFEVDVFDTVQERLSTSVVHLPFRVTALAAPDPSNRRH